MPELTQVAETLRARILVYAPVDDGIPVEEQKAQFERNLRAALPSDAEIQVGIVDRLADEAVNAVKAA